jgi:acyl carrier protein
VTEFWDDRFEMLLREALHHLPLDQPLTPDLDLFEAGMDSTAAVGLLWMVEEHYGVSIPDELLHQDAFSTAGNLWAIVSEGRPAWS